MTVRRVPTPAAEALRAFEETGNISEVARRLGISRTSARRLIGRAQREAPFDVRDKTYTSENEPPVPQDPLERILQDLRKIISAEVFRDRVETLWREDPDLLMREVERLYNALRS